MPNRTDIVVPLRTEVLRLHGSLVTGSSFSDEDGTVVYMDVRLWTWHRLLNLPRGTTVYWSDVRDIDIRELSSFSVPITYRITHGDGWYVNRKGKRVWIQLQSHLPGIDLRRKCTTVGMRAAILLTVLGGVGLRRVALLMSFLFHFEVSKSALARWVKDCAAELPDAQGMAKLLNAESQITEIHLDEIFPEGRRPKPCRLVLRDQQGRIVASREISDRDEKTIAAFLEEIKSWGILPQRFYVDGCLAYRDAIREVFPGASIQYDYFHVIQNIWKKLRKAITARRRDIKSRSEKAGSAAYAAKLKDLAKRLWENRWLLLKADKRLSEPERGALNETLQQDKVIRQIRDFALAVWSIFEDSETPEAARQALAEIRDRPEVQPKTVFDKSVSFLESRFEDMISYLKDPLVQRNSLAETGMRCLRRLERGHDGFRNVAGFDNHLRIYQAVTYCGWTVHRPSPYCHTLGLMPRAQGCNEDSEPHQLAKAA